MRIARVFPRRTKATPIDAMAFVGEPPFYVEADAVHISVAFTWDLREAERLAREWRVIAPVDIGGPATGQRGEEFIPGKYLRDGYIITSRGCPNRCWFCSVWRREGESIRELSVKDGWNILDDNFLACSDEHIRKVFAMLARQDRAPEFTGGLEAARLLPWHIEALRAIHPKQIFFAYDGPEDRDALHYAGEALLSAGFKTQLRAYVLIGYPRDTFSAAESRLIECFKAGFMPMAMLYRDKEGKRDMDWMKFQKIWARPAIIRARMKRCDL